MRPPRPRLDLTPLLSHLLGRPILVPLTTPTIPGPLHAPWGFWEIRRPGTTVQSGGLGECGLGATCVILDGFLEEEPVLSFKVKQSRRPGRAARVISAADSLSERGQNLGTTHILGLEVEWTTSFCPKPPPCSFLLPSAPSCQSPSAGDDPPNASLPLPQGWAPVTPSLLPFSHLPLLPAWSPQMQPHVTVTCSSEASCPPLNLRQRQTPWQARASSSQLPQALCPPCLLGPGPPTSSLCREGTAPPPPGSLPLCGSRPDPHGLWPSPHHVASPWACPGPGAPGLGGASTKQFKHPNLCPAGSVAPPHCSTHCPRACVLSRLSRIQLLQSYGL